MLTTIVKNIDILILNIWEDLDLNWFSSIVKPVQAAFFHSPLWQQTH